MRAGGAAVVVGLCLGCMAPGVGLAKPAPTAGGSYIVRYMGDVSCENWLRGSAREDFPREAVLNWVLGYLSRAAVARQIDLLAPADQVAIGEWMDSYCERKPRGSVLSGASSLEKEMAGGGGPKSAQLDWR